MGVKGGGAGRGTYPPSVFLLDGSQALRNERLSALHLIQVVMWMVIWVVMWVVMWVVAWVVMWVVMGVVM